MTGTVDIRPLPASHPDPDHGPRRTVAWMVLTMALFLVCQIGRASCRERVYDDV